MVSRQPWALVRTAANTSGMMAKLRSPQTWKSVAGSMRLLHALVTVPSGAVAL